MCLFFFFFTENRVFLCHLYHAVYFSGFTCTVCSINSTCAYTFKALTWRTFPSMYEDEPTYSAALRPSAHFLCSSVNGMSWCILRLCSLLLCLHVVYVFDKVGMELKIMAFLFRNFKLFFIVIMVFILFITCKAVISGSLSYIFGSVFPEHVISSPYDISTDLKPCVRK